MIATDAALEFWLQERSRESRDRLVLQYSYLCARGARKFQRHGSERADLEQIAAVGLLKACDRYDISMGTPFEAFAWLFIVGELMHFVRDHERLIRPPRNLRLLDRRVHASAEALTAINGREPSASEVAEYAGIARADVDAVILYREQAVTHSLQDLRPHQLDNCAYALASGDDALMLESALGRLTNVEQVIIVALYARGYSQMEVADRLGYSRRHVSRLHRNALKKMQPFFVSREG